MMIRRVLLLLAFSCPPFLFSFQSSIIIIIIINIMSPSHSPIYHFTSLDFTSLTQLGDQAVEMATPHWLATFEGLVLVSPGVQLIDRLKVNRF
jgi:hypothetical protein